jgi:hypothetical protein
LKRALSIGLAVGLVLACGGERAAEIEQVPAPEAGSSAIAPSASPEAAAEPAAAPPAEAELDPKALEAARRAAEFLRAQQRFSYSVESAYDAVQEDGTVLEFGAKQSYLVRRPDHARVEREGRSGDVRTVFVDGSSITMFDRTNGVYARVDRKGDLDSTIDFVRDALSAPMPLAELLRNDPRPDFEAGIEEAYAVGTERIDGQACDHVFLRNSETDIQLWVAQGERPLLARIAIKYRSAPGEPSFRARFFDWNLEPATPDDAFAFQAPEGVERIPYAVRPRELAEVEQP